MTPERLEELRALRFDHLSPAEAQELFEHLDGQAAQLQTTRVALQPFAAFAEKWNAHPIHGLADELYSIHSGAIGGSLRLSDCQRALDVFREESMGDVA